MNRDDLPAGHSERKGEDPAESYLRQVEQHLRTFTPRSAPIDVEQLERAASTPSQPVVRAGSPPWNRRAVSALASSWACGAIVGAVAMFVIVQPWRERTGAGGVAPMQGSAPSAPIASTNVVPPAVSESTSSWNPSLNWVASLVEGSSDLASSGDRSLLCAGAYLPQFHPPKRRVVRSESNRHASRVESGVLSKDPASDEKIPLQEKLLQELLGSDLGSML